MPQWLGYPGEIFIAGFSCHSPPLLAGPSTEKMGKLSISPSSVQIIECGWVLFFLLIQQKENETRRVHESITLICDKASIACSKVHEHPLFRAFSCIGPKTVSTPVETVLNYLPGSTNKSFMTFQQLFFRMLCRP